jgi:hypothetical protein
MPQYRADCPASSSATPRSSSAAAVAKDPFAGFMIASPSDVFAGVDSSPRSHFLIAILNSFVAAEVMLALHHRDPRNRDRPRSPAPSISRKCCRVWSSALPPGNNSRAKCHVHFQAAPNAEGGGGMRDIAEASSLYQKENLFSCYALCQKQSLFVHINPHGSISSPKYFAKPWMLAL